MKSLVRIIEEFGIENVMFLAPMNPIKSMLFINYTSSDDPQIPMLCKITEDRYKVKENYKITLESIEQVKGLKHNHYELYSQC